MRARVIMQTCRVQYAQSYQARAVLHAMRRVCKAGVLGRSGFALACVVVAMWHMQAGDARAVHLLRLASQALYLHQWIRIPGCAPAAVSST